MKRLALFLFLTHPLYLRHAWIARLDQRTPYALGPSTRADKSCWYLTSDPKKVIGVYFREGHKEMFKDYATCFDSERQAIRAAAKEGYEVTK
jgi:hypothetical protein